MTRALVTGGTGCIGAVAVRELLARGCERVVVASRQSERTRLGYWLDGHAMQRVEFAALDLAQAAAAAELVHQLAPTHVVHLAALQSPDCDREPARGLAVNVGSTQTLLEACERLPVRPQRFVFASSAAVYGPRALYPGPTVGEHEPLQPPNRYGTWKLAGEHLCRLFHQRTGIDTVCLRLNTTYGPGRDRGMTSAVTSAMKAIADGAHQGKAQPFRMPYRGRENYHYVEDVGAAFALAAVAPFAGFGAFNIRGETVEVHEFLQEIGAAAHAAGLGAFADLSIADGATPNLFVSDLDERRFVAQFPMAPRTPLTTGIATSLRRFAELRGAAR